MMNLRLTQLPLVETTQPTQKVTCIIIKLTKPLNIIMPIKAIINSYKAPIKVTGQSMASHLCSTITHNKIIISMLL